MAEDEGADVFDIEEFMQVIEEQRDERKEQVSYGWVETIREAGELYRDSESIEAVSEQLDEPEDTIREALTVYRLLFENPPEEVAGKASTPSRKFFSLEREPDQSFVDEDEDEPLEELVREYVGAVYLEHDIDSEPVGDPPVELIPPLAVDFGEIVGDSDFDLSEILASRITSNAISDMQDAIQSSQSSTVGSLLANHPTFVVSDALSELPAANIGSRIANYSATQGFDMAGSLIEQQRGLCSELADLTIGHHLDMYESMASAAIPPVPNTIQLQQHLASDAMANIATTTQIPDSLIADFTALQPTLSSFKTAAEVSAVVDDYKSLQRFDASDFGDYKSDAPVSESETVTSDLIFEVAAVVTDGVINSPNVRQWFDALSKESQIFVTRVFLYSIALYISQDPHFAAVVSFSAPLVLKNINSRI